LLEFAAAPAGGRRKTDIGEGEDRGSKNGTAKMNSSTQLIVARDDLQQCKFIETALPESKDLPKDALLVKVERFAFTANNITYALAGDQLKYWQLFPAPQGFGNIPVWGLGDVLASRHPNISEGERLFGSRSSPFVIARSTCDEAIQSCGKFLDCFAEPVIGRRFAPTRWLAMTA
jgi:hypothetical protein